MRSEWLTVKPINSNNREISKSVRLIQKNRFLDLLNSFSKSVFVDSKHLSELINVLDENRKWCPIIFMKYFELRDAMLTKKRTLIINTYNDVLESFNSCRNLYIDNLLIENIGKEKWEDTYIQGLREYDQKNIRGENVEVTPLNEDELNFHLTNIYSALNYIKEFDFDQFKELETFVTHIKLFKGKVLRGDTSSMGYGSMWIRIPDPHDDQVGYWIEHIIHELAHIRLESLFFHEKLVLNPYSEKKFIAPIRDDLRPMRGIFHATFVLIRIRRIFVKMSLAGMDIRFRDRLRLCELQLNIGMKTIFSNEANFSISGLKIRESFINEQQIITAKQF